MNVAINPAYSAIYGELVLALYPILIKTVPTTLLTQTLARFAVFPALAAAVGPAGEFAEAWGSPGRAAFSMAHGLLNLVHVAASYMSYQDLPAGMAVSLFYTYPIWILLGRAIFFGEALSPYAVILIGLALAGTYLVSTASSELDALSETQVLPAGSGSAPPGGSGREKAVSSRTPTAGSGSEKAGDSSRIRRGIAAALLAALTETLIYFFVRQHGSKSPFFTIDHLYPGGLALLLAYSFFNKKQVDTKRSTWLPLIAFNALLGFTGYVLRFFSIPNLSTIVFSMLSFIGVMAAHGWGVLFAGEKLNLQSLVGGGLIAGAIGLLRWLGL